MVAPFIRHALYFAKRLVIPTSFVKLFAVLIAERRGFVPFRSIPFGRWRVY